MSEPQPSLIALFTVALAMPAGQRAAYLAMACGNDAPLRRRVEALIGAHEAAGTFMECSGVASPPDELPPAHVTLQLAGVPDEVIGQKIGRYEIIERVGEGGCGVVYLAEQTGPVCRRVAMKFIKLGLDARQLVARFETKRQVLARLDHPNIAKVLDAGTTGTGRLYFIMELVRGIRITDYCDHACLTIQERLELFINVCEAIQYAHQKGLIHRAIKPSNILITLNDGVPVPKVMDFGIAWATDGCLTNETVCTQLPQFISTLAYLSPEPTELTSPDIDSRCDIYSLGVLLYELLAGAPPFDAQELMSQGLDAMRKMIREKDVPRPSIRLARLKGNELTTVAKCRAIEAPKLITLLKGDLDWMVMKCLEKNRTRRYETANGLAADLKRHLNAEPVIARPPSIAWKLQKAIQRNRFAIVIAAAIIFFLALGATLVPWPH